MPATTPDVLPATTPACCEKRLAHHEDSNTTRPRFPRRSNSWSSQGPSVRDSDHVSSKETEALLGGGLAARKRHARLDADDMVSTTEAAELAKTSRVTVNSWIKAGRCIGLVQTKRGLRVPEWAVRNRVLPGPTRRSSPKHSARRPAGHYLHSWRRLTALWGVQRRAQPSNKVVAKKCSKSRGSRATDPRP